MTGNGLLDLLKAPTEDTSGYVVSILKQLSEGTKASLQYPSELVAW